MEFSEFKLFYPDSGADTYENASDFFLQMCLTGNLSMAKILHSNWPDICTNIPDIGSLVSIAVVHGVELVEFIFEIYPDISYDHADVILGANNRGLIDVVNLLISRCSREQLCPVINAYFADWMEKASTGSENWIVGQDTSQPQPRFNSVFGENDIDVEIGPGIIGWTSCHDIVQQILLAHPNGKFDVDAKYNKEYQRVVNIMKKLK